MNRPFGITIPNQEKWLVIKENGLFPEIDTPEKYAEEMTRGMFTARLHSQGLQTGPWLDARQIGMLHALTFQRIFTLRGNLRADGLERAAVRFEEAKQTRAELEGLTVLSRDWFQLDDPVRLACEMAAFTGIFYAIRPFAPGTAEVAQLILAHQAENLIGRPIGFNNCQTIFEGSVAMAGEGWLTPLAKLIFDCFPEKVQVKTYTIGQSIENAIRQIRLTTNDLFESSE